MIKLPTWSLLYFLFYIKLYKNDKITHVIFVVLLFLYKNYIKMIKLPTWSLLYFLFFIKIIKNLYIFHFFRKMEIFPFLDSKKWSFFESSKDHVGNFFPKKSKKPSIWRVFLTFLKKNIPRKEGRSKKWTIF